MKKTMVALSAISSATSLSLMSSSAFAYGSASASIKDLSYALDDVNLYDGITPKFEIHRIFPEHNYSDAAVFAYDYFTGEGFDFSNTGGYKNANIHNAFSPVSAKGAISHAYANVRVGADRASAQAYAVGHDHSNGVLFGATAIPSFSSSTFTLSPQTSITFTGKLAVASASSDDAI